MGAKKIIKRCTRCGLPETYPGIRFDDRRICNYCIYFDLYKEREDIIRKQLKNEFLNIISSVKRRKQKYECLVGCSGGKDSTFLLYLLNQRLKLNILAYTLDNGFLSSTALSNIEKVTKTLNIDHRFYKPNSRILKDIYVYALTNKVPYPKEVLALMSPLCCACHAMVFSCTLNLAIKLKIPLIFTGYTPGQYPGVSMENFFKTKSCIYLSKRVYKDDPFDILKILSDPIREKFGKKVDRYYFKSQYIPEYLSVPKIIFPFHALFQYNENEIIKKISKLGWEKSNDTDPFSSNCLLNSLGNYACVKQRGYHPYSGEYSQLVREGKMSREKFMNALKIGANPYALEYSLKKLGLTKRKISRINE